MAVDIQSRPPEHGHRRDDTRAFGLLQVDDIRPRDFDQDNIEFLRTHAGVLGPVIDRLYRFQELRSSEARFRAIVETATDYGIFTIDPEGLITTWPPGAQAVYGWPRRSSACPST